MAVARTRLAITVPLSQHGCLAKGNFQVMVWWILQSGYRLKCLTSSRRDSWHGMQLEAWRGSTMVSLAAGCQEECLVALMRPCLLSVVMFEVAAGPAQNVLVVVMGT
jgi:hypothetical protein